MKIFFDGGCRPNGRELAVVMRGRIHVERDLGAGGSMAAEWLALIAALRLAARFDVDDAILLGDAAAVIAQARGTVRVPPDYRGYAETFAALLPSVARIRLRYVRRGQNLAGIALDQLHEGRPLFEPLI
ncbi:reverse transcriptase-like protein [Sphingomonas sp. RS2018]